MAALFAVGLPFTYDGTTNHFATTTGGSATVAAVTSADTVTVDGNSGNATLTIGAAFSCSTLTINNASATVACDGTHGMTVAGVVTLTTGTLNTNGQACSWGQFVSTVANTRTLDITNSTITITLVTGGATAWDTGTGVSMTFTSTGSTVIFSQPNQQLRATAGSTKTFNNVTFNAGGTATGIGNDCTITGTLTITGTAAKTNVFFMRNSTIGTLVINGNSVTNRILICGVSGGGNSAGVGTQFTQTVTNAPTLTNADFMDIKAAGTGGTWAGTSMGDSGGNSNITFDAPTTQYRVGATSVASLWSDSTKWASTTGGSGGTGRIPLPQDDVIIDNNSTALNVNVVIDMPRAGRTIDSTGYTLAGSFAPMITTTSGGVATTVYGSWLQAKVFNASPNVGVTFAGRGAYSLQFQNTMNAVTISAPSGTYTMLTNLTGNAGFSLNNGTFDAAGFAITVASFVSTATTTRVLKMGGGTWSITTTSATTFWSVIFTGLTLTNGGSAIVLSNASANNRTFAGGGWTYGALTYTVAGSTGSLIITGANTFAAINFSDVTNARTLTLPASTVTTVSNGANFQVNGTAGKLMTLNSSLGGTQGTLAITSGTVNCDYLAVVDNAASVTTPAYAGAHGTISNTTNWNLNAFSQSLADTITPSDLAAAVNAFIRTIDDTAATSDIITPTKSGGSQSYTVNLADILVTTDVTAMRFNSSWYVPASHAYETVNTAGWETPNPKTIGVSNNSGWETDNKKNWRS